MVDSFMFVMINQWRKLMVKLEFTDSYGSVFTIKQESDIVYYPDIIDSLIKPVFLAAGFHPKTVDLYGGEEEELNND